MGERTSIEWTDATWNPVGGCSIATPGCTNCYAQQLAGTRLKRHPLYAGVTTSQKGRPLFNGHLTAAADEAAVWAWPVLWRGAKAPKLGPGMPSMIFTGDMSDLFHADRPRHIIDRVVGALVHSRHIGQLLTKRAEVMHAYFTELRESGRWRTLPHPQTGMPAFGPDARFEEAFARLWLGVSAERQPEADERIPLLLRTPAAVRFVSCEPLLGPVDLTRLTVRRAEGSGLLNALTNECRDHHGRILPGAPYGLGPLDLVITGGESGRHARPMHPDWPRWLRDQCQAAGAAFLHKQNGEWVPGELMPDRRPYPAMRWNGERWADATDGEEADGGGLVYRVGRKAGGRLLDGRVWNEFPAPVR